MRDYLKEWTMGEDTNPPKEQVSARVDVEIAARIELLADIFGIKKSAVIEGALDVGTRDLLHTINYKHPLEQEPLSDAEKFDRAEAKAEYEEAKRDYEDSKGDS